MKGGRIGAVLGVLAALAAGGRAEATEIAAVFSGSIEPYVIAYEGFADVCPANYWKYDLSEKGVSPEWVMDEIARKKPDLVLAIGSSAYRATLEMGTDLPVVFTMVLDQGEESTANIAGASIRVDPAEEMEYVRLLFPQVRSLGVVYDPDRSGDVVDRARKAAAAEGIDLTARPATDLSETLRALRELEDQVDGWWLIPDRTTLTEETVEYLLVESLRRGKPIVAPSRKYVERGAHVALVPDYAAIGEEAGRVALRILGGERPGLIGIRYAQVSRIVVNDRTSREAGVDLSGSWAKRADRIGR